MELHQTQKNTLINTIPKEVIQKQCAHRTQIAI